MKSLAAAISVLAAAAASAPALADEEPLVTDRPDFTESSSTVGMGVVQLEGGFTSADLGGGDEVTTVGELLARWGVLERLELRLVVPTYARQSEPGGDRSGWLDTVAGLKVQVADGGGRGFLGGMEASLIASTTLPTGSGDFSSSAWQPAAVLAAGWVLGPAVGLGVNLGLARAADDGRRFTSSWVSSAVGFGVTERLSVFVELIGFNRQEVRGSGTLTFQAGAVYLVSPNLQLDLRGARRLTEDGPDLLIGAGLSLRFGS